MVGDGNQVVFFGYQVINELPGRPAAIAIGGMHVQVNGGIG